MHLLTEDKGGGFGALDRFRADEEERRMAWQLAAQRQGFTPERPLEAGNLKGRLEANAMVGVPYTAEMIDSMKADLVAQADPMSDAEGLLARYPGARVDDFDGNTAKLTEMDALVAYLQVLGTMVRFNDLTEDELQQ